MRKIAVLGLWRNSEEYISRALTQFEDLTSLKGFHFDFFFYENDSKDSTVDILTKWCPQNNGKIKSEILGVRSLGNTLDPDRMVYMAHFRNQNKQMVSGDYDFALVIDTDVIFHKTDIQELISAADLNSNGVVFTSNCRQNLPDLMYGGSSDSYYDVGAFRDQYGNNGMYFTDAPFTIESDIFKFKQQEPVRITTGFGGISLIRFDVFKKIKWSSIGHIEHVNFCYEAANFGQIWLIPKSRPRVEIDFSKYDMGQLMKVAAQQLESIKIIKERFTLSH